MGLRQLTDDGGESSSLANINNGRWTDEEHQKFVDALRLHGKDWNLIQEYIGSRTSAQIRSHAQKYFSKLFKEGKLDVLEMFDNLLSNQRLAQEEDASEEGNTHGHGGKPIMKTKTITKNYGTRLGKPQTKVLYCFHQYSYRSFSKSKEMCKKGHLDSR